MTEDWRFYDVFFTRAREYYIRGLKALSALLAGDQPGAKPVFGPAADESSVLSGPAAGPQASGPVAGEITYVTREILSVSDWVRQAQIEAEALNGVPALSPEPVTAGFEQGPLGAELTQSGGLLLSLSDDFIRFRHAAYEAARKSENER